MNGRPIPSKRYPGAVSGLLQRLPGAVGVEGVELLGEFGGVVAKIALVGDAILIDLNSHYSGFAILGWLGKKRKIRGSCCR